MILTALFLLTLSSQPIESVVTYGPYTGYVSRVIDGDTVEVDILIYPQLTKTVRLRLDGVNAPELHTKLICEKVAGIKAKLFVEKWLGNKRYVIVDNLRFGKFAGRMLGTISRNGSETLGKALVAAGLAKEYHGGKRQPWCED